MYGSQLTGSQVAGKLFELSLPQILHLSQEAVAASQH